MSSFAELQLAQFDSVQSSPDPDATKHGLPALRSGTPLQDLLARKNSFTLSTNSSSSLDHGGSSSNISRHWRMDSRDTAQTSVEDYGPLDRGRRTERGKPLPEPPILTDPWSQAHERSNSKSFVAQLGSLPISTVEIGQPSPLDSKWESFLKKPMREVDSNNQIGANAEVGRPDTRKQMPQFQRHRSASFSDLRSAAAKLAATGNDRAAYQFDPKRAHHSRDVQYSMKGGFCQPYLFCRPRLTEREDSFIGFPAEPRRRNSLESTGTSVTGILRNIDNFREERDRWQKEAHAGRPKRYRKKSDAASPSRPDVRVKSNPLHIPFASTSARPSERITKSSSFQTWLRTPSAGKHRSTSRDVGVQTDDELMYAVLRQRRRINSEASIKVPQRPAGLMQRSSSYGGAGSVQSNEEAYAINYGQAITSPVERLAFEPAKVIGKSQETPRNSANSLVRTKNGLFYSIPNRPAPAPVYITDSDNQFGPPDSAGKSNKSLLPLLTKTSAPSLLPASDSGAGLSQSSPQLSEKPSSGRMSLDTQRSADFTDLFFRPPIPALAPDTNTAASSPTAPFSGNPSSVATPVSPVTPSSSVHQNNVVDPADQKQPSSGSVPPAANQRPDSFDSEANVFDFVHDQYPQARESSGTNFSAEYRNVHPDLASLSDYQLGKRRLSIESKQSSFLDLDISPTRVSARNGRESASGRSFIDDLTPPTSPLLLRPRESIASLHASDSASQVRRESASSEDLLRVPAQDLETRLSVSSTDIGLGSSLSQVSSRGSQLGSELASFPAPPRGTSTPPPPHDQQGGNRIAKISQASLATGSSDQASMYSFNTATPRGLSSRSQLDPMSSAEKFVTPAETLSSFSYFDALTPTRDRSADSNSYLDLSVSPERHPDRSS